MIFISLFLLFAVPLAWIDFKYYILPDFLTFSMLWCGLLINSFYHAFCPINLAILGVVIGYLSLYIVYWVYYFFTQKEGLGFGDFKLFASLGAWFGVYKLPQILFLGSIMGLLYAILVNVYHLYDYKDNFKLLSKTKEYVQHPKEEHEKPYLVSRKNNCDDCNDSDLKCGVCNQDNYQLHKVVKGYIAFGPFLLLSGAFILLYKVDKFSLISWF
jgi:prepilin signal peptidase PulO-like enzyme (type II secretory pathway)